MHFISEEFLLFALAFSVLFFALGRDGQKALWLVSGYLFCGYVDLTFAGLVAISTLGNHFCALLMERNVAQRRKAMWGGIFFNVALLGVFKYFNFFTQSFTDGLALLGVHYSPIFLSFAIPLGLSFYSFQAISYLVDLNDGKIKRASLFDYAVFMSFWPKFVAGPIIRARSFLPQLQKRRYFRWANFYLGAEWIIYGLFLKTVLSDYLAPQVRKVYAAPAAHGSADALLAALFFTFQIYGDFAGYSLMVIGMARIFGYSIQPNFRRPNFARSFSDFWSRWHISLSTWLDEYIFRRMIPKAIDGTGREWASVVDIYGSIMEASNVTGDDTFSGLSGDSLSFVQVALALEQYLGQLPNGWETMTINQLEKLKYNAMSF